MAHIIAISNHKGGCGKTTSTINIGAALAQMGHRTLLVDLDPQANLTISLGIDPDKQPFNTHTALTAHWKLQPLPVAKKLEMIPACTDLVEAELKLATKSGREDALYFSLQELLMDNPYKYVLLDCPPSLGLLTVNALTAAEAVYIPLQAQYLALQGLAKLQEVIALAGQQLNKRLRLGGVFVTQYDSRKVLHRNVKQLAEQTLGAAVCKTVIRDNIALAEAPTMGQTIYQYAPKSNGAADYMALAKEIHTRSCKQ